MSESGERSSDSFNPASKEPAEALDVSGSFKDASLDQPLRKDGSRSAYADELIKRQVMIEAQFSGPLPAPHILKAYDLIEPGLAREIVEMAKNQSRHRMILEKTVTFGDSKRAWAGLFCGFTIACLSLGGSIYSINKGHDWAGVALGTGSLAGLVGVFVYGTGQRRDEREKKRDLLVRRVHPEKDEEN